MGLDLDWKCLKFWTRGRIMKFMDSRGRGRVGQMRTWCFLYLCNGILEIKKLYDVGRKLRASTTFPSVLAGLGLGLAMRVQLVYRQG